MKIAFICNKLTGGGAERFTANIANRFSQDSSNSVYVITGKRTEEDYSLNENITRFEIITKRLYKDSKSLLKLIREHGIEVVVGIDIYPNFVVCLISKFTKAKCVISERNAPKQVNISKKSRFLRWLLYRFADGYVFQTNGAKEFYSKSIQKRSVVIHNPIRENLPSKTNVNNKEIVAIGRLNVQKNYPMLINAFYIVHNKYPNYKLRIFGDGELKESLLKQVNNLHLNESVIFENFTLNVHEAIRDSSIYVMTSDFEGMPNSLMEAMAMGFPVVSTDCPSGGPGELITDGVNGMLCKVGDYKDCAEKICSIIENYEISVNLAENAKSIMQSHNTNIIMTEWENYLE